LIRYLLAAAFVWLAWRAVKATPRGKALTSAFGKAFGPKGAKTVQTPHQILGVSKVATTDEVRRAYRTLAKRNHPDVVPEAERDEAEERMLEIQRAYDQLSRKP